MNLKLSVKNIVAIVLLVLTVVLLFWPAVAGKASVSETRSALSEMIDFFFMAGKYESTATFCGILAILLNICFFGTIAAAVLAIVLIVLNKGKFAKIAALVTMILAILAVVTIVALSLILAETLSPGVAMFLIPIVSIAACTLVEKAA